MEYEWKIFVAAMQIKSEVVHSNLGFMIIFWFIKSKAIKVILISLISTWNTFLVLFSLLYIFVR